MTKILTGSVNTGKKIMDNLNIFSYKYIGKEDNIHKFEVSFGNQKGTFNILINGKKIDESSTLCINDKRFPRALGIYNDPSLLVVAERLINSLNE